MYHADIFEDGEARTFCVTVLRILSNLFFDRLCGGRLTAGFRSNNAFIA
jgi:hypothetical protein